MSKNKKGVKCLSVFCALSGMFGLVQPTDTDWSSDKNLKYCILGMEQKLGWVGDGS